MTRYRVIFSAQADRQLPKLDKHTSTLIIAWILKHLENCENPRARGKGILANRSGQWRYRVGDYRIIADINDGQITILILTISQRRDVY